MQSPALICSHASRLACRHALPPPPQQAAVLLPETQSPITRSNCRVIIGTPSVRPSRLTHRPMATHAVAVCRPIAGASIGYIRLTELAETVVDLRREGMRTGRRSAAAAAQAMRESIQL